MHEDAAQVASGNLRVEFSEGALDVNDEIATRRPRDNGSLDLYVNRSSQSGFEQLLVPSNRTVAVSC